MIVRFNGKETIVAAALKLQFEHRKDLPGNNNDQFLIVSKPPPNRHHNLLWLEENISSVIDYDQGFITSTGRYVTRKQGMIIAVGVGQLIKGDGSGGVDTLFSECIFDHEGLMFAVDGREYRSPARYWGKK